MIRGIPTHRISPPSAAARVGDPAVMWEARIKGNWTHAQIVMAVNPVTTNRAITWGGDVWATNVETGEETARTHITSSKPHLILMWTITQGLGDGDLVQIMAEPSDPTAALWVDSVVLKVDTAPFPAHSTPSDPIFVPPNPGWGEAKWGIDTWSTN